VIWVLKKKIRKLRFNFFVFCFFVFFFCLLSVLKRYSRFPIMLYLVGSTKEIVYTAVEELTEGEIFDFGDQFTDIVGIIYSFPPLSFFFPSRSYVLML
jgi:hypothetical protein